MVDLQILDKKTIESFLPDCQEALFGRGDNGRKIVRVQPFEIEAKGNLSTTKLLRIYTRQVSAVERLYDTPRKIHGQKSTAVLPLRAKISRMFWSTRGKDRSNQRWYASFEPREFELVVNPKLESRIHRDFQLLMKNEIKSNNPAFKATYSTLQGSELRVFSFSIQESS